MSDILRREANNIMNADGGVVARFEANNIILEDGAGGGSSYSTEEKKVGKWIDGSTLYQKTIQTEVPAGDTFTIPLDTNINNVCYMLNNMVNTVNGTILVGCNEIKEGGSVMSLSPNIINHVITVTRPHGGWAFLTLNTTIQYTKAEG